MPRYTHVCIWILFWIYIDRQARTNTHTKIPDGSHTAKIARRHQRRFGMRVKNKPKTMFFFAFVTLWCGTLRDNSTTDDDLADVWSVELCYDMYLYEKYNNILYVLRWSGISCVRVCLITQHQCACVCAHCHACLGSLNGLALFVFGVSVSVCVCVSAFEPKMISQSATKIYII